MARGHFDVVVVAAQLTCSVERLLMVSSFTRLPNWKAALGVTVLSLMPPPVCRATPKFGGRYLFGPAGDQPDHSFFDSLRRTPPGDVARRTNWLRGRTLASPFSTLSAPAHVWLGAEDRLVNLEEQISFFSDLADDLPNVDLTMILGWGDMVLPSAAVEGTRGQLQTAMVD